MVFVTKRRVELKMSGEIVDKLKVCRNREDLEKVFDIYSVYPLDERIKLMKRATGEINEYFSNGNGDDLKEDYEYELITFVDGAWRIFSEKR